MSTCPVQHWSRNRCSMGRGNGCVWEVYNDRKFPAGGGALMATRPVALKHLNCCIQSLWPSFCQFVSFTYWYLYEQSKHKHHHVWCNGGAFVCLIYKEIHNYVFVFYLSATKVGHLTFSTTHVMTANYFVIMMTHLTTSQLHLWPMYRH